jgi:hypothetical protein
MEATTMSNHFHTKGDELHVFWIPADTDIPMQMKVVKSGWGSDGQADRG